MHYSPTPIRDAIATIRRLRPDLISPEETSIILGLTLDEEEELDNLLLLRLMRFCVDEGWDLGFQRISTNQHPHPRGNYVSLSAPSSIVGCCITVSSTTQDINAPFSLHLLTSIGKVLHTLHPQAQEDPEDDTE